MLEAFTLMCPCENLLDINSSYTEFNLLVAGFKSEQNQELDLHFCEFASLLYNSMEAQRLQMLIQIHTVLNFKYLKYLILKIYI